MSARIVIMIQSKSLKFLRARQWFRSLFSIYSQINFKRFLLFFLFFRFLVLTFDIFFHFLRTRRPLESGDGADGNKNDNGFAHGRRARAFKLTTV